MSTIVGEKKKRQRRKVKRTHTMNHRAAELESHEAAPPSVEIEYIMPDMIDEADPYYAEVKQIFERFEASALAASASLLDSEETQQQEQDLLSAKALTHAFDAGHGKSGTHAPSDDAQSDEESELSSIGLSKKKARKLNRMSIAELKKMVRRPEVVEWVDITANDPVLLVNLKSIRNSVPIPAHWSQKRKYLQGKRGIEKPPFQLPSFIRETGITEMRDAVREKDAAKGLKSKTRERLQPKMGKLSLDYEKLHDAFFRYQTKPRLTIFGDLYHEGKEFEMKFKHHRPGLLSEELKNALGMSNLTPPPWLINMQRYGPPPGYLHLKIPGVNAPIPEGAQWGYQPCGWGKAPVNEYNQPLYGDVFGVGNAAASADFLAVQPIDSADTKSRWGELEIEGIPETGPFEDEEEPRLPLEDVEKETDMKIHEQPQQRKASEQGQAKPIDEFETAGYATPGFATPGFETPDIVQLRKETKRHLEADLLQSQRPLYTVVPQKVAGSLAASSGILATSHVYDVKHATALVAPIQSSQTVTLNPDEMGDGMLLDPRQLASAHAGSQKPRGAIASGNKESEDLSDMMAEHVIQQERKKKKAESVKKGKEFKF